MEMENYSGIKAAVEVIFADAADFREREITLGRLRLSVMYISNYSSKRMITEYIISPVCRAYEEGAFSGDNERKFSPEAAITCASVSDIADKDEAKEAILEGSCLVIYAYGDGDCRMLSVSTKNEDGRSVTEPETENVIRGAHEGFVESGEQNAMLLRRRLKTERLKKIDLQIGRLTKTAVSVMYIDGIADKNVINELLSRLRAIKADSILDSGYIELYIQDGGCSLYPTVGNSERPDKVAAKMLEGRAAVIVDGSPVVLTVPYLFCEALQVTEDYSKSVFYSCFVRLLRFVAMTTGIYLPALFVALTVWHPSLLPAAFEEALLKSREGMRFSIFAEVILIFLLFEIVREVGLRMPKAVGSAVGLVGSLILGESAVKAGIASSTVMVFVALAAICNFIAPPYMNPNVIYRLAMILAAGAFGLFGFSAALALSILSFCSKKSFGVPYLYPLAPMDFSAMQDSIFMLPVWKMKYSPSALSGKRMIRTCGRKKEDTER